MSCVSIDQFADLDTQKAVNEWRIIDKTNFDTLGALGLLQLVQKMSICHAIDGIVIGSGFESSVALMNELKQRYTVFSNSIDTYVKAKNPKVFFKLLDEIGIRYPNSYLERTSAIPEKPCLVKQIGADGGAHIRWFHKSQPLEDNEYLQEYYSGQVASVSFIANAQAFTILGINRLFQKTLNYNDFCYAGAMQWKTPNSNILQQVEYILGELVQRLNLKGLCGLDFIITDDMQVHVLELNPRPTATAELYDSKDFSVFNAHIKSFQTGNLPIYQDNDNAIKAYRIIYACDNIPIAKNFKWPAWVKDIPAPGQIVKALAPLCSIHACADIPERCLELLDHRETEVNKLMNNLKIIL